MGSDGCRPRMASWLLDRCSVLLLYDRCAHYTQYITHCTLHVRELWTWLGHCGQALAGQALAASCGGKAWLLACADLGTLPAMLYCAQHFSRNPANCSLYHTLLRITSQFPTVLRSTTQFVLLRCMSCKHQLVACGAAVFYCTVFYAQYFISHYMGPRFGAQAKR